MIQTGWRAGRRAGGQAGGQAGWLAGWQARRRKTAHTKAGSARYEKTLTVILNLIQNLIKIMRHETLKQVQGDN